MDVEQGHVKAQSTTGNTIVVVQQTDACECTAGWVLFGVGWVSLDAPLNAPWHHLLVLPHQRLQQRQANPVMLLWMTHHVSWSVLAGVPHLLAHRRVPAAVHQEDPGECSGIL